MKKNDLKTGMIVVLENNEKRLVLTNCSNTDGEIQDFILIGKNGFLLGKNYNDQLEHNNHHSYNIKEILFDGVNYNTYHLKETKSIWKREE